MSYPNKRFSRNQEDYIDFPVSPVWRNHYADQGLTWRTGSNQPSRSYQDILHKIELGRMRDQVNAAEIIIARQHEEIERLESLLAKKTLVEKVQPGNRTDRRVAVREESFVEY